MYFTQDIANKIKQRLKDNNAKAKNMLSDLSLGVNTISEFSKGKQLSCITLARIADYLDCSVDYLLGRTDNKATSQSTIGDDNVVSYDFSDDEKIIFDTYKTLDIESRAKLLSYIVKLKKEA